MVAGDVAEGQPRPTTAKLNCVPQPLSVPPSVHDGVVPIVEWRAMDEKCRRLVAGCGYGGEQTEQIEGLQVGRWREATLRSKMEML